MKKFNQEERHTVKIILNGEPVEGIAEPRLLLTDFLRHEVGATGTHVGCEHGICGAWGGIAAGIFGLEILGGLGGVTFMSQLIGTISGVIVALVGGFIIYGLVHKALNIRLTQEEEFQGADLSIHKINSISSD